MPFRRLGELLGLHRERFPSAPALAPAQRLIVGLGNPGKAYGSHRHNIGWMVAAELACNWGVTYTLNRQMLAKMATTILRPTRVILAQPITYMNNSGDAVIRLIHWYKFGLDDILIVYDDKDLPLGKVRLRTQGSAGSHNGMMSIIQKLQTERFPRLRVGIGPKPESVPLRDFVLSSFTQSEEELRQQAVMRAAEAVKSFVVYGPEVTMQNFN